MRLNHTIFILFFFTNFCLAQNYFNDSLKKAETAANDYIDFYQKYISGIRGQECPMYPSCSNFGLKTFNEKNFGTAFVLTSDRLLRCGHDHSKYSLTLRENGFKFIDYPVYDSVPKDLYFKRNKYHFAYSNSEYSDSSKLFIENLINQQFYQEALLEIMRLDFISKVFDIDLFINKIICLKALGEYEKALYEFSVRCPDVFKNHCTLVYHIGLVYKELANYSELLNVTVPVLESCQDINLIPKIYLLNGYSLAKMGLYNESIASYKSLAENGSFSKLSEKNIDFIEQLQKFKHKSPFLAGSLGLIPGLGYVYCGHKQTGFTAFLVNGLITYATYNSIRNKNYGMGALTGVFNLSFYLGSITGAVNSAKRYNEKKKSSILSKIQFYSYL